MSSSNREKHHLASPSSPLSNNSHPEPQSDSPSPATFPDPPEDPAVRAERIKEQGNVAFKASRYHDAIDLYTQAIGIFPIFATPTKHLLKTPPTDLNPSEPSYLTNRAASHMALKRFRPALKDCQAAATLQTASPVPKTILRLARCHFALGDPTPALSALRPLLTATEHIPAAHQLHARIRELAVHLANVTDARARRDWGVARLAMDKCLQTIEAEGEEVPTEWRLWRVEMELARGNWDTAHMTAKCVRF
jgi:DnaJ family protein C protein 7